MIPEAGNLIRARLCRVTAALLTACCLLDLGVAEEAAKAGATPTVAASAQPTASRVPAGVTLPLVIFDVDWQQQTPGLTPLGVDKAWLEAVEQQPWSALPWRTYSTLDFLTRTRTARVETVALGLEEQPLVLTVSEGHQPNWGPRVFFTVPREIAATGLRYRVSLDVCMANVTRLGGVSLQGVGELRFTEDGSVLLGKTEVCRYQPAKPLHLDFLIDVETRQLTTRVDDGEPLTMQWADPRLDRFVGLRLDALLPGGFARAPGQLAFDNILIILEK